MNLFLLLIISAGITKSKALTYTVKLSARLRFMLLFNYHTEKRNGRLQTGRLVRRINTTLFAIVCNAFGVDFK